MEYYPIPQSGRFDIESVPLQSIEAGDVVSLDLNGFLSGGAPSVLWSIDGGALPPGLSLSASGNITGTVNSSGFGNAWIAQVKADAGALGVATQGIAFTFPTTTSGTFVFTGDLSAGGTFIVTTTKGTPANLTLTVGGVEIQANLPNPFSFTLPLSTPEGAPIVVTGSIALPASPAEEVVDGPVTWVVPLATQSNMLARAADSAAAWPSGVSFARQDGVLVAPSASIQSAAGDSGPFTIAKHFAIAFKAARPNDNLVFVPGAVGGTGFSNGRWNPGDDLFDNLVDLTNQVLTANPTYKLRCMLVQGFETDAGAGTSSSIFRLQVAAFAAALRDQIEGAEEMPMVFGEMASSYVSNAARTAVRDEVLRIPVHIDKSAIASSRSPSVLATYDNTHFTTAAAVDMGARMFAALATADTHVAPGFPDVGEGPAVVGFSNAESAATSSNYTFPGLAVSSGTVFIAVTARGTSIGAATVSIAGATGTFLGAATQASNGAQRTEFWRFDGVSGIAADVVVNFPGSAVRCGVAVWSVEAAGSATFATTNVVITTQSSLSLDRDIPAGALVLAHATGIQASGATSPWAWWGADQRMSARAVSPQYSHSAADVKFASRHKYAKFVVEFSPSMTISALALLSIAPVS